MLSASPKKDEGRGGACSGRAVRSGAQMVTRHPGAAGERRAEPMPHGKEHSRRLEMRALAARRGRREGRGKINHSSESRMPARTPRKSGGAVRRGAPRAKQREPCSGRGAKEDERTAAGAAAPVPWAGANHRQHSRRRGQHLLNGARASGNSLAHPKQCASECLRFASMCHAMYHVTAKAGRP